MNDLYKPLGDSFQPPPETGEVRLPNGCTLYWKMTEQGREYFSDEVGGGVQVWHTALVDQSTLLAAIVQEQAFQKLEYVIREREQRRLFELNKDEIGKMHSYLEKLDKAKQQIYDEVYGTMCDLNTSNNAHVAQPG